MKKHPHLARKFLLLYKLRINPAVQTHSDLAEQLGISRQAVSRWVCGTVTSTGDRIPATQLVKIAEMFDLDEHWFTLGFEEFEANLIDKLESQKRESAQRPEKITLSLLPITNAKIFGRDAELDLLDSAWQNAEINVVQVIAFGGVGKSTSINCWLSRLDQCNYRGAKRVYAWSFYWQGSSSDIKSSGDFFIEHALDWFGDERPTEGTPWAKATRLANLIRASRTLLILDGLEPLQYPPGPKSGQVENPAVALLIRELASDNKGLCIITSRLAVADLAPYQDGRVQTIDLSNLSVSASVQMLKSMGVEGDEADYVQAVKEYTGHPLSLSLLGGYLCVVHQGDIGKFRELKSLLDEQNLGTHAKNLMQVYLNWFKNTPECSLLYLIGLFDRATTLEDMKSIILIDPDLAVTKDLAKLTHPQWSYAIKLLCDANLISIVNRDANCILDCHPLVRDFIADYLKSEQIDIWTKGHELIFQYLQQESVDNPSNMAELEPLFRAVIHGTQAGLYEAAFQLYFERIKGRQFSLFTEGSHHADQACIRTFFKKEWTETRTELGKDEKFYLLSCAATNLIYLGEINEAIEPSSKSINWFIQHEKWLEASITAGPLISMLIAAGRMFEAFSLIDEIQECVENTNNSVVKAMAFNFHAYAYHLHGRDDKAKELFEKAENILIQCSPCSPVTFPTVSSYYCKFLLDTGAPELALQRSLKTFAWREQKTWQVAIDTTSLLASDILVLGLVFLQLGDRTNARIQLDRQVELLKSADEWLYLPTGLNSRAEFHIETNNFQAAMRDLEEALSISLRTGAKFSEWETYINFAQLHYGYEDYDSCKAYLQRAKDLPDMGMYRFRDAEIDELNNNLSRHGRYLSKDENQEHEISA